MRVAVGRTRYSSHTRHSCERCGSPPDNTGPAAASDPTGPSVWKREVEVTYRTKQDLKTE